MDRNRMSISLAGQEFRIAAGNDEEYMRGLEAEINRRVKAVRARFPKESTSRCVLLAMLEMQDELTKLAKETSEVDRKIKELQRIRESGEEKALRAPVKRPFERKKPVGV